MSMTRLPNYLGLDFGHRSPPTTSRSCAWASLPAHGVGTVEAVMGAEIDASERRMRERLRQIPTASTAPGTTSTMTAIQQALRGLPRRP
jgi:hypothetical protein